MISGREALKKLTNSLGRSAGRNSSGRITVFHRGGGSKRLQRRIDLKRSASSLGIVERIEYDPNRSSWIALVEWIEGVLRPVRRKALSKTKAPRRWRTHSVLWAQKIKRKAREQSKERIFEPKHSFERPEADKRPLNEACEVDRTPFTYILASHQLEAGKMVINYDWSNKPSTSFNTANKGRKWLEEKLPWGSRQGGSWLRPGRDYADPYSNKKYILDSYFQMVGNCIPLAHIARGAWVHNIEWNPGEGAKLTRAAGTKAKIVEKLENTSQCIVRLPSGVHKLLDSRCRATIGIVSNPNHDRKLNKAGENRWLGRRPIVRGVAMNPVDHPHGGGEGRTSGGRPSVSPWGKPTKSGFKTVVRKRKN